MATVRKRGNYYFVDYYYNGKRIRKLIKTQSKRVAESYLIKILSDSIMNNVTNIQKIEFEQFRIKYLDYIKRDMRFNTYLSYELVLRTFSNYLKNCTKCIYLDDIKKETVNDYKLYRLSEVSPNTVNLELRTLRAFFYNAIKQMCLRENPVKGIKFAEIDQKYQKMLTEEECGRLIIETKIRYPNPNKDSIRSAIITLIYTGMRKSELINLKWDQIDFKNKCFYIESDKNFRTKTGKKRIVPMFKVVEDELKQLKRKSEYVFSSPNECSYKHKFYSKFMKIAKSVKLDWVHPHILRHNFASYLEAKGIPFSQISEILGHRSIKTTMDFYSHTLSGELQNAIKVLPDFEKNIICK